MSNRYYWKRIRPILLSVILCCVFFLTLMAVTSNENGNLTIYIDRNSATKTLSLSENAKLENPKGKLEGPSITSAWEISPCGTSTKETNCIPNDTYLKDGDNSGTSYLSYTFYLYNSGSETLDYEMNFEIENVSKELDETIRVRLYINDALTTYAKKSPVTNEPELLTTAFESESKITSQTVTGFEKGAVTKYSIILWVETTDNETTNDKIGGSITLSMRFSVLDIN